MLRLSGKRVISAELNADLEVLVTQVCIRGGLIVHLRDGLAAMSHQLSTEHSIGGVPIMSYSAHACWPMPMRLPRRGHGRVFNKMYTSGVGHYANA